MAGTEQLSFGLLGPLVAYRGRHEVATGPAGQQAVLAFLLMRAGSVGSPADIVEALWGQDPPATARGMVRTYLCRLRRGLGADLAVRESCGYRSRIEPGQVDVHRFENLLARARSLPLATRAAARSTVLRQALSLVRGEPLTGLPGPFAQMQRRRLDELRWAAFEDRIEADLAAGRCREAATDLGAIAEQPLRERLVGLLMLALHQNGRRAEALALYHDLMRRLADELGIDPSAELRARHEAILREDPELERQPAVAGEMTAPPRSFVLTVVTPW